MSLSAGQRQPLAALGLGEQFSVRVSAGLPGTDIAAFGLQGGQLEDDRYMVFYNQPESPDGSISLSGDEFSFDLQRLSAAVSEIVLTATHDDTPVSRAPLSVSLGSETFDAGAALHGEKAAMLLRIYRHTSGWRVEAVGQGFNGGLGALVEHFGGEVADDSPPPATPAPTAPAAAAPRAAPTPPAASRTAETAPPRPAAPAPTVNLQKVTLEKQGQGTTITLAKNGASHVIRVNLNWDKGGGFLRPTADLDLGCMYILKTGEKGVIQALGRTFGAARKPPFIKLDRDDRTGAAVDGENLVLYRPDLIKKVVVFAYIYQGTSDFTRVSGVVTIKDAHGSDITVQLDNPSGRRKFCGIALIEPDGPGVRVTKEERYFNGHRDCDRHFGFRFHWTGAHK